MPTLMAGLDDRRARFIREYVKDLNITQAALRAGYSPKTAAAQGSRLLKNVEVRAQVDVLLAKLTKRNDITVERTVQEIARIAYGDTRRLFNSDGSLKQLDELDEDAAALLASIETETRREGTGDDAEYVTVRKIKRWDKVKALDQCMAYLGMHKTADLPEGLNIDVRVSFVDPAKPAATQKPGH